MFTKPSAALPATSPTSAGSSTVDSAGVQSAGQRSLKRADVSYAQGQLAIKADNSSLNQILREVGRQTGIKITGGVSDERVFGKYGPSPTAEVLAELLEGTGSNLLLLHSDASSPGELILTPRQGGISPPNPNAPGFDDESSDDSAEPQVRASPPEQVAPAAQAPLAPNTPGAQGNTTNGQVAPASGQGSIPNGAAPAPASTDAADPNAVRTPQQIYEQLQRLRQQQQQTAPQ